MNRDHELPTGEQNGKKDQERILDKMFHFIG